MSKTEAYWTVQVAVQIEPKKNSPSINLFFIYRNEIIRNIKKKFNKICWDYHFTTLRILI